VPAAHMMYAVTPSVSVTDVMHIFLYHIFVYTQFFLDVSIMPWSHFLSFLTAAFSHCWHVVERHIFARHSHPHLYWNRKPVLAYRHRSSSFFTDTERISCNFERTCNSLYRTVTQSLWLLTYLTVTLHCACLCS